MKKRIFLIVPIIFIIAALFIFLNVVTDLYMALVVVLMVFVINDVLINSKVKITKKHIKNITRSIFYTTGSYFC